MAFQERISYATNKINAALDWEGETHFKVCDEQGREIIAKLPVGFPMEFLPSLEDAFEAGRKLGRADGVKEGRDLARADIRKVLGL